MICYICLEKRGDYIKKYINWKLINNNEVIINNENIECEFDNNIIKYIEDKETINLIDLDKEIYIRENNEFIFEIDFKNRLLNYILKENDLSINNASIEASFIKDNPIILKYNLGDEEKEIVIHIL